MPWVVLILLFILVLVGYGFTASAIGQARPVSGVAAMPDLIGMTLALALLALAGARRVGAELMPVVAAARCRSPGRAAAPVTR